MTNEDISKMLYDLKTGDVGAETVSDLKYIEPIFWNNYGLKMIQRKRIIEAIEAISK